MMHSVLSAGVALVICCGVSAWIHVARAEPPASAITEVEAEIELLVRRAIELRRSRRDAEALVLLEGALLEAPSSVRLAVHVAAAHQALGHWVEAERQLSDALRKSDDPYIRRHRATLDRTFDFVASHLGSLDVIGGPEGAELLLSGRPMGQLPLAAPLRVPTGRYLLEVRKEGYYSLTRPITIDSGSLLRESVVLGPREQAAIPALTVPAVALAPSSEEDRGSPRWLTWTLAGTGLTAAAASVVAFQIRERHAKRWNGDACTRPGLARGQVCPDELDAGRSGERWGIGASILSGALLGGALSSFLLQPPPADEERSLALDGCGFGVARASCFGSF